MNLQEYIGAGKGNGARLAGVLGVSPSYISQLSSGERPTSPARCVQIEQATNGQVTRRDLRPHDWARIWPELAKEESNG